MPSSVEIFSVTKFRPGQHTNTLASVIFTRVSAELNYRVYPKRLTLCRALFMNRTRIFSRCRAEGSSGHISRAVLAREVGIFRQSLLTDESSNLIGNARCAPFRPSALLVIPLRCEISPQPGNSPAAPDNRLPRCTAGRVHSLHSHITSLADAPHTTRRDPRAHIPRHDRFRTRQNPNLPAAPQNFRSNFLPISFPDS